MTDLYIDARSPGRRIRLGSEVGEGAYGTVYRLVGSEGSVAKLYNDKIVANTARIEAYRDKIDAMIAVPPKLPPITIEGRAYVQIAWPIAKIVDENGTFRGFTMPEIDTRSASRLENILTRDGREIERLSNSYLARVLLATRLAGLMAELHQLRHFMVDLKPENIMFYRDTWIIAILDVDGFSINGPRRYFAGQWTDEYLAPEGFGKSVEELGLEQDLFALAVLVFQLLNDGIHPYQGVNVDPQIKASAIADRIKASLYAYGLVERADIAPKPSSIHDYFEDDTRRLFDRAFQAGSPRPTAAEWRDHLKQLIETKRLVQCSVKPAEHWHFSAGCGLCAYDRTKAPVIEKRRELIAAAQERARVEKERVEREAERARLIAQRPKDSLAAAQIAASLLVICAALFVLSAGAPAPRPAKDPASLPAMLVLSVVFIAALFAFRRKLWRNDDKKLEEWLQIAIVGTLFFSGFLLFVGLLSILSQIGPALGMIGGALGFFASAWAAWRVARNYLGPLDAYRNPFELFGPLPRLLPQRMRSWIGFPLLAIAAYCVVPATKEIGLHVIEPQLGWCQPGQGVKSRAPPRIALDRLPQEIRSRVVRWQVRYDDACRAATFEGFDSAGRPIAQQAVKASTRYHDQVLSLAEASLVLYPAKGENVVAREIDSSGNWRRESRFGCDGRRADECVESWAQDGRGGVRLSRAILDWRRGAITLSMFDAKGLVVNQGPVDWSSAAKAFFRFGDVIAAARWAAFKSDPRFVEAARAPDRANGPSQPSGPGAGPATSAKCREVVPVVPFNAARSRTAKWSVSHAADCSFAVVRVFAGNGRLLLLQRLAGDGTPEQSYLVCDWEGCFGGYGRFEVQLLEGFDFRLAGITRFGCGNPAKAGPSGWCMQRLGKDKTVLAEAWLWVDPPRVTYRVDPGYANGWPAAPAAPLYGENGKRFLRENFYLVNDLVNEVARL